MQLFNLSRSFLFLMVLLSVVACKKEDITRDDSVNSVPALISLNDPMAGDIIVYGNKKDKTYNAFALDEMTSQLQFEIAPGRLPIIFTDDQNNEWNLFGKCVEGPLEGHQLQVKENYLGYWLTFPAFFETVEVYQKDIINKPHIPIDTASAWTINTDYLEQPTENNIMAISNPDFIDVKAKDFLDNDYFIEQSDNVLIFKPEGEETCYVIPIGLLERREVINMHALGYDVTINYCPLTGTAYAWNTQIPDTTLNVGLFGVSGLIYNNNLIMANNDGTLWSQVLGKAIFGPGVGTQIEPIQLIKTSLSSAFRISFEIKLYNLPGAFPENAYAGYLGTDDNLPFVLEHKDELLPFKQEVFAVELSDRVVVFELDNF